MLYLSVCHVCLDLCGMFSCACARACVCVRACMRVCVRACVHMNMILAGSPYFTNLRYLVGVYIILPTLPGRAACPDQCDSPPPIVPVIHGSPQFLRLASGIFHELVDVCLVRFTGFGVAMLWCPQ